LKGILNGEVINMDKRQYDRTSIEPLEMVFDEIEGSRGKYEKATVFIDEVSFQGVRFTSSIDFLKDEMLYFRLPTIGVGSLFSGKISWKKELGSEIYQYGLHIIDGEI
jgi:hypothetical protein